MGVFLPWIICKRLKPAFLHLHWHTDFTLLWAQLWFESTFSHNRLQSMHCTERLTLLWIALVSFQPFLMENEISTKARSFTRRAANNRNCKHFSWDIPEFQNHWFAAKKLDTSNLVREHNEEHHLWATVPRRQCHSISQAKCSGFHWKVSDVLFPSPPLSKTFKSFPSIFPHISMLGRVPSFLSSFELSHFAQIKQLKGLPSSVQGVMQAVRYSVIASSPGNNCRINMAPI